MLSLNINFNKYFLYSDSTYLCVCVCVYVCVLVFLLFYVCLSFGLSIAVLLTICPCFKLFILQQNLCCPNPSSLTRRTSGNKGCVIDCPGSTRWPSSSRTVRSSARSANPCQHRLTAGVQAARTCQLVATARSGTAIRSRQISNPRSESGIASSGVNRSSLRSKDDKTIYISILNPVLELPWIPQFLPPKW